MTHGLFDELNAPARRALAGALDSDHRFDALRFVT
jgi:hypothetical protein